MALFTDCMNLELILQSKSAKGGTEGDWDSRGVVLFDTSKDCQDKTKDLEDEIAAGMGEVVEQVQPCDEAKDDAPDWIGS